MFDWLEDLGSTVWKETKGVLTTCLITNGKFWTTIWRQPERVLMRAQQPLATLEHRLRRLVGALRNLTISSGC